MDKPLPSCLWVQSALPISGNLRMMDPLTISSPAPSLPSPASFALNKAVRARSAAEQPCPSPSLQHTSFNIPLDSRSQTYHIGFLSHFDPCTPLTARIYQFWLSICSCSCSVPKRLCLSS